MQFYFFSLLLCTIFSTYSTLGRSFTDDELNTDLLYDVSDFDTNPPLAENDFWDLDSISYIDAEETYLLDTSIASDACSSPLNPLGRRGESCTDEKPDNEVKPVIQVRPLGRTEDAPLKPLQYNFELCPVESYGHNRNLPVCDSGDSGDIHPREDSGNFDLDNCSPCMFTLTSFSSFLSC